MLPQAAFGPDFDISSEFAPIAIAAFTLDSAARKSRRRFTELRPGRPMSQNSRVDCLLRSVPGRGACRANSRAPLRDKSFFDSAMVVFHHSVWVVQRVGMFSESSWFIFREVKAASRSVFRHFGTYRSVRSPRHPSNPSSLLTDRFRDSVVGVPLRKRHLYVEPNPQL
ncbi:hypothetical protein Poly21_22120 [Allorhodopirellula heiligendammensis]|uniref:Uncharacterized protein n=1 Tax=Allorhodopirellula heiligendammensis TaxID=2714739 RepID=A0A5C6C7C5_9BACT|nr:hypothetical protein Poly21_22120 [Allorhodopirellula heiligendammensis]